MTLYSSEHKFTHLLFTFSCVGIDIVKNIYRSSNISQVVNAMVDALTSDPPLDRYIVGIDARGLQLLSYLPASVADFLFHLILARKLAPPKGPLK